MQLHTLSYTAHKMPPNTRCPHVPHPMSQVRRIGAKLSIPFPLLAALAEPFPLPLRDFLYDQVAGNRYNLFGRSDSCRLSGNGFKDRFISD